MDTVLIVSIVLGSVGLSGFLCMISLLCIENSRNRRLLLHINVPSPLNV
jgi:hypothetical protein